MNWRKIGLFLLLAFGISWLSAAGIYFGGIEYGKGLSILIVACLYMPAPAISALIVQKYIYKEPFEPLGWTWKGIDWKWIFGTILISIFFVLGTMAVIGLAGNTLGIASFGSLDLSEDAIIQKIVEVVSSSNQDLPVDLETELEKLPFILSAVPLLSVIFLAGIFAAFSVNLPFMFGEEFGWRGLFLKETQQLGFVKSNLLIGIVWGLWHAPIILMGHNYPEYPVIGVGMMCLFTTALAFPFAYIRLKTKSILGPCVMHGMINGTAASLLYFTWGGHSLVTGMTGIAGLVAISSVAFAVFLFDRKFVKDYPAL